MTFVIVVSVAGYISNILPFLARQCNGKGAGHISGAGLHGRQMSLVIQMAHVDIRQRWQSRDISRSLQNCHVDCDQC
jgi:hypothetical protein